MPVGLREFEAVQRALERHEIALTEIRVDMADLRAELRGAAREGAKFGGILVAVASAIGVAAQIAVALLVR